jgi:hypothetical protein
MLRVEVTNTGARSICTRADTIMDPSSLGMDIELKDAAGRSVRAKQVDLPAPSIHTGLFRLDPGMSVHGLYDLASRFRWEHRPELFTQPLKARAGFTFTLCNDSTRHYASSDWQPI